MEIRIDQSRDTPGILDSQGVHDIGHVVYDGFDLFRIDVLPGRAEDHALRAALEVEVAVGIHHAYVAGPEPAVFGEAFRGCCFVLEVAEENIGSPRLHFAGYLPGIRRIDAELHVRGRGPAGIEPGPVEVGICDDRGALRHPVAHREREADLPEELLDFRVEGRPADDHLLEPAAERSLQFTEDLVLEDLVEKWQAEEKLVPVYDGLQFLLVDLLYHQRHGDYEVGFHVPESLDYHLRARDLRQEEDMGADRHFIKELEHHPVHVGHGKDGHDPGPAAQMREHMHPCELQVRTKRPVWQHDSFREAGST